MEKETKVTSISTVNLGCKLYALGSHTYLGVFKKWHFILVILNMDDKLGLHMVVCQVLMSMVQRREGLEFVRRSYNMLNGM